MTTQGRPSHEAFCPPLQETGEPLIHYARSAFLPQKQQIVRSEPRDSSTATAEASYRFSMCT